MSGHAHARGLSLGIYLAHLRTDAATIARKNGVATVVLRADPLGAYDRNVESGIRMLPASYPLFKSVARVSTTIEARACTAGQS